MTQKINIGISDYPKKNFKDRLGNIGTNSFSQQKNRVLIHERKVGDNKLYLVEDTTNLIVYRGRNWLMQRAFKTDMENRTGWSDRWISWLGVGTGGTLVGDPLTPASPTLNDCGLSTHGTIGSGLRYVTVGGKDYHLFDNNYPIFVNDPDINNDDLCSGCIATDPVDLNNYSCDKFLIALVKTTITSDECNGGSDPDDYQDISELGLFVAPSASTGYGFVDGDMQLFARVCFSTVRKTSDRELIISWYIYY